VLSWLHGKDEVLLWHHDKDKRWHGFGANEVLNVGMTSVLM